MQKKTNIYAWLGLMGCTMVWAGCPNVKLGGGDAGDAGMVYVEDSAADAGTEIIDEPVADAGWTLDGPVMEDAGMAEVMDAGMEEIDDCTATEAGEEMTDDTNMGWTCAPQEDEDMCFNDEYDWEERCANETCVTTGALCYRLEESLWYNECLEANSISGFCDDAVDHEQDEDSPVIYKVTYDGIDSSNDVATFTAELYYEGDPSDLGSSLYSQKLKLLSNGDSGYTYTDFDGTNSATAEYVPEITSDGSFHTLTFYLTVTSAEGEGEFAIYLTTGSKDGNAYCFTNDENMPQDPWTYANNPGNDLGELYEAPEDCEPSE